MQTDLQSNLMNAVKLVNGLLYLDVSVRAQIDPFEHKSNVLAQSLKPSSSGVRLTHFLPKMERLKYSLSF